MGIIVAKAKGETRQILDTRMWELRLMAEPATIYAKVLGTPVSLTTKTIPVIVIAVTNTTIKKNKATMKRTMKLLLIAGILSIAFVGCSKDDHKRVYIGQCDFDQIVELCASLGYSSNYYDAGDCYCEND